MLIDNFAELVYSSLLQGFLYVLTIPAVAITICGLIFMKIFKLVIGGIVYTFSATSGCTQRQAKRNVKKSQNIIDIVSAVNDINI